MSEITKEQYQQMQANLKLATEHPAFKKLRDHKELILVHLSQPAQTHLEEYYSNRREEALRELVYSYRNKQGNDVSDILRGKIMAMDEMLRMKDIFSEYEQLKKTVESMGNIPAKSNENMSRPSFH